YLKRQITRSLDRGGIVRDVPPAVGNSIDFHVGIDRPVFGQAWIEGLTEREATFKERRFGIEVAEDTADDRPRLFTIQKSAFEFEVIKLAADHFYGVFHFELSVPGALSFFLPVTFFVVSRCPI